MQTRFPSVLTPGLGRALLALFVVCSSAASQTTTPSPTPAIRPTAPDTVSALGTWTLILDRPLGSKYEGMSWPDAKHGYVISDRGDILASKYSGATWTVQASKMGSLRSLDFLDSLRGYAGTLAGKLYRTLDGGTTWTDITSSLPNSALGFCGIGHFGNKVHVVGRYTGSWDYFSSNDGGNTWQHQSLAEFASGLVDVVFLTDQIGFIGGIAAQSVSATNSALILKTTDGGAHWKPVYIHQGASGWAWKIYPASDTVLYAALAINGEMKVAKSVDRGDHWTVATVASSAGSLSRTLEGIGFLDENIGWVGGFFPGMYATTDGGATWHQVTDVASSMINRYRKAGNTIFTAGTKGILRYDPRPVLAIKKPGPGLP